MANYNSKVVSAAEAVSKIQSNQRVYTSGNAAAPLALLQALSERKDELRAVELTHVLLLGKDPCAAEEMKGHFFHNSLFVGPADRDAINAGRGSYIPIHLHQIPQLFAPEYLPVDAVFVHTSMPDKNGYLSLGVEVLATPAAMRSAKYIIAQVNPNMPRTLGDSFIHISDVDAIVEVNDELPTLKASTSSEAEKKIGKFIADLIDDGATLQLGIGGIPDAVLSNLDGKKDLGVHTEMISDGLMKALSKGIITGARKNLHPNKIVSTFILGSKELYEFSNDNPMFELHPTDYTNDPFIASKNDNLVAINSAVELDFTGQICSGSIGPRIYSGFGGQVDFMRGAANSKGGIPIIALSATAKDGEISRIVPALKESAGVVTTRADVRYVVTEYGVANLFGKNFHQRVRALIDIAHPKFREELETAAGERRLLPRFYSLGSEV